MSRIKERKLEQLILGTLLVYVTLHLAEGWLFGFPAWAEARWGIPNYTTSKWLLHNVYFAFFLALGYFVYRRNEEKLSFVGLGIVIWGLLNSVNHVIFTAIYLEYSPGLFTGLIFLLFTALTWQRLRERGKVSWRLALPSIVFGLLYWGLPMFLFIEVDRMLGI